MACINKDNTCVLIVELMSCDIGQQQCNKWLIFVKHF